MAETFEGLHAKFGADTVEFDKGIKGMNTAIAALRKEMTTLNNQLKLDPGNIDLLNKKYENFQEQLRVSALRVEELKKKQKDLGDEKVGTGEWTKLQSEIGLTESKMQILERAMQATKRQIDEVGDPKSVYNLNKAIEEVGKDLDIVNRKLKLDPKNVDLSREKMRLLGEQSKLANEKIEALKKQQQALGKENLNTPEWKKLQREIGNAEIEAKKLTNEISEVGDKSKKAGDKVSIFGDVLKASLAADAIKAGLRGVIDGIKNVANTMSNFVLKPGFDRAMKVEEAQFKLKGLGHDAQTVDKIMENAIAAVKGTAFGLDQAATIAASAVAAGIKPGQELERTLKLVADASAIAGTDMDEMGAIFNKVASAGKISAEEINQLNERGIPITKLLADTMGVSTEKVKDLVSAGKVGFPEFQTAIEKGMGGAAQAMGGTFEGSIKNVKAALSRMGEGILTPFIKNMTPELGDITSAIDDIAKKLAPTFEEIAKKIDWKSLAQSIVNAVTGIINFIGYISEHKDVISALATALGIVVAGVWALTAAQTALNLAMSLNPIGSIVIAVAALVAGLIVLWNNCEGFRNFVIALWETLKTWWDNMVATWNYVVDAIKQGIQNVKDWWNGLVDSIKQKIDDIKKAYDDFKNKIKDIVDWIKQKWDEFTQKLNEVKDAWDNFKQKISDGIQWIKDKWQGIKDAVQPFIDALNNVKKVWDDTIGKIQKGWGNVKGFFSNVKPAVEGLVSGDSVTGRSFNTYATNPMLFKGYPSLPEISAGQSTVLNINVTANNADAENLARVIERKIVRRVSI